MQLFTKIDDANAIISLKGGVQKQVPMYQRDGKVYVGAKGGFVRITSKFGETYGTTSPDIKLVDFEADGVTDKGGALIYCPAIKAAA